MREMLGADEFDGLDLPRTGAGISQTPGMPLRLAHSIAAEWAQWWARAVDIPADAMPAYSHPGAVAAPDLPMSGELRAFISPRWPEVLRVADRLNRRAHEQLAHDDAGLAVTNLMTAIASELGRQAHPFQLDMDIVPFPDKGMWRVAPTRILISLDLYADPEASIAALDPVLRDLA
ncbi:MULTISPECIES: hypothetical protein [unclassified Salinibacterium]|uniref:hypothetical protein n=1 Tax=unclassified Salinibacterium TaxID=2632331 RepID=UPI00142079BD|nr:MULTISPECIES: hypothetical protein [unclassified Salinibacterium]